MTLAAPSRLTPSFPKRFNEKTSVPASRYAEYRCRPGTQVEISYSGRKAKVGNEWVVPFGPFLCSEFKAHINVEVCAFLNAVEYIHKYIHKGSDRATIEFNTGVNEIREYLSGRYLGAIEYAWGVLGFPIFSHFPSGLPLVVHLPNRHTVKWRERDERDKAL